MIVFLGLSTYAAFCDVTRYRIANWIALAVLADFLIIAAIAGLSGAVDPWLIAGRLGAGAVMLIAGFALFAAGLFGGGDAKLIAASALWFGGSSLFRYVVLVALMGGLLALIILGLRRFVLSPAGSAPEWLKELRSGNHGIPYGVAIAAASWLMFCPLVSRAAS